MKTPALLLASLGLALALPAAHATGGGPDMATQVPPATPLPTPAPSPSASPTPAPTPSPTPMS